MNLIKDDILTYREMCDTENIQTLQRGMNYRLSPKYSVVLMSQRSNAPYNDRIHDDGITIEYEGHNISRRAGDYTHKTEKEDQPAQNFNGSLTQNGLFKRAVEEYKLGERESELVKIYEKVLPGVWSMKGFFDLVDYKIISDGGRNVFRFILRLSSRSSINSKEIEIGHVRLIPSHVKQEVWKRDEGKCVLCGETKNLHFDHELPFSKGGTSLSVKNVRLLCMKCNLKKSDKIE